MHRQLAPEDQTHIYRIVGFHEYLNALQMFDDLMRRTTDSERQVIDEIIKEHDEFAVYTNLSRRFEAPDTMPGRPEETHDNFERRGLAWVMALARVEVGAMLAGFTKVRSPFAVVGPTEYELPAYRELLADGARTHYFALANDPQLRRVITESATKPGSDTVAYVRRISVAREFLNATGPAFRGSNVHPLTERRTSVRRGRDVAPVAASRRIESSSSWKPANSYRSVGPSRGHQQSFHQQALQSSSQLKTQLGWQTELQRLQQGLTANLNDYLSRVQRIRHARTKASDKTIRLIGACSRQLAGERYELQHGLARIETTDLE